MKPIRRAFTLVELLVVIAIIGVLVALLVPAIQKVRAAAASAQCMNNLKHIGLAAHDYHNTWRRFPGMKGLIGWAPSYWQKSWLYNLLPFLEQEALHKQGQVFNASVVGEAVSTILPGFICPSDPRENAGGLCLFHFDGVAYQFAMTCYLGVVGENSAVEWDGVFGGDVGVTLDQITDGTSSTLMAGERPPSLDNAWGWWSSTAVDNALWAIGQIPANGLAIDSIGYANGDNFVASPGGTPCPTQSYFSPGDLNNYCHVNHFWSFHHNGGNWLLCDGSVRFMTYDAGVTVIPPMATIKGGETVELD
jgi:prepilin-type N-terminal cleavage/methylation domain-containing protein